MEKIVTLQKRNLANTRDLNQTIKINLTKVYTMYPRHMITSFHLCDIHPQNSQPLSNDGKKEKKKSHKSKFRKSIKYLTIFLKTGS